MGTVRNILIKKGNDTYSTSPDSFVFKALGIMLEKNVTALLVLENEQLIGMFSESDYARKVALQGKSSKTTRVRDVMTSDIRIVQPETKIDHCMQLMTNRFTRHLPVIDGGQLVGIISIGDVVKYIIEEQQFIIENMEHYINGT